MFTPDSSAIATMASMNTTYSFKIEGPILKVVGTEQIIIRPGRVLCLFYDLTVGGTEPFATGEGLDEPSAFADGLRKSTTAPKPLTPAQRATANLAAISAKDSTDTAIELAKAHAEIASLNERLAAAEKPKSGRGGRNIPGSAAPMENTTA